MDNISYYDVDEVPFLTFKACLVTAPFISAILLMSVIALVRSKFASVKRLMGGVAVAMLFAFSCDLYVMFHTDTCDFSRWGFIWIFMGFFSIAGNMVSWFITRQKTN